LEAAQGPSRQIVGLISTRRGQVYRAAGKIGIDKNSLLFFVKLLSYLQLGNGQMPSGERKKWKIAFEEVKRIT
jgi:hypothetical protein